MSSGFFNVDNKFFSTMSKIMDLIIVNTLFLLTLLIGIGPACTALYYSVMKNIRKSRSYVSHCFFHSFKQNFKLGFITGILQLIFLILIYWCYDFAMQMNADLKFSQVYYAGVIVIFIFFMFINVMIYPILSRFTLSLGKLIKMSFVVAIRHFATTLILVVLLVGTALSIYLFIFPIFFMPALYTLLSTFLIEPVFRKYMPAPEEGEEVVDAWWLEQ